jgi:DNA-binding MurR/RpiR family transcriptional regulator
MSPTHEADRSLAAALATLGRNRGELDAEKLARLIEQLDAASRPRDTAREGAAP